ncbi:hypothetical protein ccbrp13_34220 [Ktedonobacteria bacterium brp13]|nr:hypothetical protein ccbrp13_34220 [Ktedonobacteria bacterium brp13]
MKNVPSLLESVSATSTEGTISIIIEVAYEPFNYQIYISGSLFASTMKHEREDGNVMDAGS